jgi:hypothetical protein
MCRRLEKNRFPSKRSGSVASGSSGIPLWPIIPKLPLCWISFRQSLYFNLSAHNWQKGLSGKLAIQWVAISETSDQVEAFVIEDSTIMVNCLIKMITIEWHWGPFLTSPLGANFDTQGRSCPPGMKFVPPGVKLSPGNEILFAPSFF